MKPKYNIKITVVNVGTWLNKKWLGVAWVNHTRRETQDTYHDKQDAINNAHNLVQGIIEEIERKR